MTCEATMCEFIGLSFSHTLVECYWRKKTSKYTIFATFHSLSKQFDSHATEYVPLVRCRTPTSKPCIDWDISLTARAVHKTVPFIPCRNHSFCYLSLNLRSLLTTTVRQFPAMHPLNQHTGAFHQLAMFTGPQFARRWVAHAFRGHLHQAQRTAWARSLSS